MFPYIKIDPYLFVYIQFIFSFLHFLFLQLLTLDYFVKYLVLLGFLSLVFTFICVFHETAKICCKSSF